MRRAAGGGWGPLKIAFSGGGSASDPPNKSDAGLLLHVGVSLFRRGARFHAAAFPIPSRRHSPEWVALAVEAGGHVTQVRKTGLRERCHCLRRTAAHLAANDEALVLLEGALHDGQEVRVGDHARRTRMIDGDVDGTGDVAGGELGLAADVDVRVALCEQLGGFFGGDDLHVRHDGFLALTVLARGAACQRATLRRKPRAPRGPGGFPCRIRSGRHLGRGRVMI